MLPKQHSWRIALLLALFAQQVGAAPKSDRPLQQAVTRAMAAQRGTALVLDVHSGELLASYHLDVAAKRVVYPGSSIKPFTLKALLQSGKLNSQTTLMCKRRLTIAGRKLDCTHPDLKQPLDPAAALAYSCNSYFTTVALRLTPEQLRHSFIADGFTSITSLTTSEATGHIELAQSREQLQVQAIGEWGIEITPLELAHAYRRLALLVSAHEPSLEPLFDGLQQSVAYGMGRAAQPAFPMNVAGKTGTAPADEGRWTHAWFAGYAPANNPEIVVLVFLEKGHGGGEAASVARDIFSTWAQSRSGSGAAVAQRERR